jgi:pimeloyl-ACP methyl ester carboxylesterase
MATKKSKKPLVLLHGIGGSRADWEEAGALLAKTFSVLALDLPGAGAAPKPASGYDPVSLARYVSGALTDADIDKALVIGHSLGARVAGELATHEPPRVSRLVLVSPLGAVRYSFTDRLKWKAMSRRSILSSVPDSSIRSASAYGFAVDSPGKKGFVERAVASRTGPNAAAVSLAVEKSVDGILEAPPLVEVLRGTRMPLLVVAGATDPLAPPDESEAIRKARPDARFLKLPGLGHYPMLEDPGRFVEAVRDFLTG